MPPSHKIVKTTEQWRIGARVEKWSLRPEVQEFCGQFPVYRLEPFTPDTVAVVDDTRAGKPVIVYIKYSRLILKWYTNAQNKVTVYLTGNLMERNLYKKGVVSIYRNRIL